jgi:hypothetical protein
MAISKNNRTMISMILISLFFLGISPAAAQDTALADTLSTIDDALSMLKDALSKLNDVSTGNDTSTGNDGDIPVKCDSTSSDCCWATRILQQMGKNISFSLSEPNACCGFPHDPEFQESISCVGETVVKLQFPPEKKFEMDPGHHPEPKKP